jgi:hypothetical protein
MLVRHVGRCCFHGYDSISRDTFIRRRELKRGGIWFLEKEPSHWMIHFPETRLHGMRSFKNTEFPPA